MSSLILASASPRRLMLLEQIGIKPNAVVPADIDETSLKNELPAVYAMRMAMSKAEKIASDCKGDFILAADTVVACGRRILPKAETEQQAVECLNILSGRRHCVYGSICLVCPDGKIRKRLVKTTVAFSHLHETDKQMYLDCGEWEGKAGGYAIQGKASLFIREILGSYSNIVGLSLYDTSALLKGNGYLKQEEK